MRFRINYATIVTVKNKFLITNTISAADPNKRRQYFFQIKEIAEKHRQQRINCNVNIGVPKQTLTNLQTIQNV